MDTLDLVNMRMGAATGPRPSSLTEAFGTLVEQQREASSDTSGSGNATPEQIAEALATAPSWPC